METPELLYTKALKVWGKDAILAVAYSECAELAAQIVRVNYQGRGENLVDEMADVAIMAEQLKQMFGINPQPIAGRPMDLLAKAMVLLAAPQQSPANAEEIIGLMTGAVGAITIPNIESGEVLTLAQAQRLKLKRLAEKLSHDWALPQRLERLDMKAPPDWDAYNSYLMEGGQMEYEDWRRLKPLPDLPEGARAPGARCGHHDTLLNGKHCPVCFPPTVYRTSVSQWIPIATQMPPEGLTYRCKWRGELGAISGGKITVSTTGPAWWKRESDAIAWYRQEGQRAWRCAPPSHWTEAPMSDDEWIETALTLPTAGVPHSCRWSASGGEGVGRWEELSGAIAWFKQNEDLSWEPCSPPSHWLSGENRD